MRFQAQQGAVFQAPHPALVAADRKGEALLEGGDVHHLRLARLGQEEAHRLDARATGKQTAEHLLARIAQALEQVARFFQL
jgi:hypothetical protein